MDKRNLIGYTPAQLQWNEEHEPRIWKYMVEQNHLYEQNNLTINKYINDAPYTLTLSPDSPGRVGAWMGWQIVSAYMEKNQVPMIELFRTDSQKILKESGYNP